jgi:ATP-dependent Clp protease ATP-binding subunit ClpC
MVRWTKFNDDARKVLTLSQDEAQRFGHNYIATEHLLLGLIGVERGAGAKVLRGMGAEPGAVREAVELAIANDDRPAVGEVGLSPGAKQVIELSIEESRRLGHDYLGTEHLLLGLVAEGHGIAAVVLESMGIGLDGVREAVERQGRRG